jgi:hypothetical protein
MHINDEQFRCLLESEKDLEAFQVDQKQDFYCLRILINNETLDIQMNDFAIFEMVFPDQASLSAHFDQKQLAPQVALDWVGTLLLKKNDEQQVIHQTTLAQSLGYVCQFFSHQLHPHFAHFPRLVYTFRRRLVTLNQIDAFSHDFYLDDSLCFYLPLLVFQKQMAHQNEIFQSLATAKEQVFLKDSFGRYLIDLARKSQQSCIPLAQETQIRLKQVLHIAFHHKSLRDLKYLPIISKSWMAEYHLKRLLRLPSHNQLDGFEYEAKLSTQHLLISERDLPYPILERYQTESIRWYREEKRIGFRGERASVVIKGEAVMIDGIAKRPEEKTQQLSTWDFHLGNQKTEIVEQLEKSEKPFAHKDLEGIQHFEEKTHQALHLEMRRMKRQLYVLSPNRYFYAVCLDYCTANQWGIEPLRQIEIEYNGQLIFEDLIFTKQWWDLEELKRQVQKIETQSTKLSLSLLKLSELDHVHPLIEKIDLLLDQCKALSKQLRLLGVFVFETDAQSDIQNHVDRLQNMMKSHQAQVNQLKAQQGLTQSQTFDAIEKIVVAEMNEIIDCLSKRQKVKPSKKTKKKWLKDGLDQILQEIETGHQRFDDHLTMDQILKMKASILKDADDE